MASLQIAKFETIENNEQNDIKHEIKPILRKDAKQFTIQDTNNIQLIDKGSNNSKYKQQRYNIMSMHIRYPRPTQTN